MAIDRALSRLEADQRSHMLAGPSSEAELTALEAKLGRRLPEPFRRLLGRLGGGILYQRHEIFGEHRTMVHDIEMVPDVLSMRVRLQEHSPGGLGENWLPIHRSHGAVHLLDLEQGPDHGRVLELGAGRVYPDLASFLESVVIPGTGG